MEHEGCEGAYHTAEKDEEAVDEAAEGEERGKFGLGHERVLAPLDLADKGC